MDERQIDGTGAESGSELQSPPLLWSQREQIRDMVARLRAQGAEANWSCGLDIHAGLEKWGQAIVRPLAEAALTVQDALRELLQTSGHRLLFCPPLLPEMVERFAAKPDPQALRHRGRPQSHRCGVNAAAWFDIGTVEIRYANGSLDFDEIANTIELCLRFVAAVGAGRKLPGDPQRLAQSLGAPASGYPPAIDPPRWYRERMWLEEHLLPILTPHVAEFEPEGEILQIIPVEDGMRVVVETPDGKPHGYTFRPVSTGWERCR